MIKSIIKLFLTIALIGAMGTSMVFGANLPADVAGRGCEKAVSNLLEAGVVTGDTDGLFHPDSNLTRAQVCIMLARVLNPEAEKDVGYITLGNNFTDMKGYGWAAGAIGMLSKNKMAKGYANGNFKPGASVTMAELITFAVRACGAQYSDENIGGVWPENYINKAKSLGLLDKNEVTENYQNQKATKEAAAVIVNSVYEILKVDEDVTPEKEPEIEKAVKTGDYYYGQIKFSKDVSKISCVTASGRADVPIKGTAAVYAYGKASDFSTNMKVPSKSKLTSVYIYKYPNVKTKALYKIVNGSVTEIILPESCGFSGNIYGVINSAEISEDEDGAVIELETLTAGMSITWTTKAGAVSTEITNDNGLIREGLKNGELFELTARKGLITSVCIGSAMTGKYHKELTDGKWSQVTDDRKDLRFFEVNNLEEEIYVTDSARVYIYDAENGKYKVGRVSDIKKNQYIRAYDISDDDDASADIVIATKKL